MFLNEAEIERDVLRQGDIISQVHLLGAINLNSIVYHTSMGQSEHCGWSISQKPKFGDAMVLSHSCEIALENKIKVTSIILAPLRDVHQATSHEFISRLIETNLINDASQESFLKYFYVTPYQGLEYASGAVVDFSKCFSLRKQVYDLLLKNKIAQLSHDAASAMALKLALYFHRNDFKQTSNSAL